MPTWSRVLCVSRVACVLRVLRAACAQALPLALASAGAVAQTGAPAGAPAPVIRAPAGAADAARQGGLDLSGLAAQYDKLRSGKGGAGADAAEREISGVVLFASLGMPRPSLERLIEDAIRLRVPIVLRGVVGGSVRATSERIRALNGDRQVAWSIDPMLFRRFEVTAVPALVLIDPARPVPASCDGAQCRQTAFAKVAGDVTAAHALHTIATEDPAFAPLARRFLAQLPGGKP